MIISRACKSRFLLHFVSAGSRTVRRRFVSLVVTLCLLLVQTAALACASDGCDDSHERGPDLCHCCQIGDRCAVQVAPGVGPPPEASLLGQLDRLLPSRIDSGTDDFVIGALLFPDSRGPPFAN